MINEITHRFSSFTFYKTKSSGTDGPLIFSKQAGWKDDAPTFLFFKDGLEEKESK